MSKENNTKQVSKDAEDKGHQIDKYSEVKKDLLELDIKLKYASSIYWTHEDLPKTTREVAGKIWTHRTKQRKPTITITDIVEVLANMIEELRHAKLIQFKNDIKYSPDAKDTIDEFAHLLTGNNYDKHYPIILKHVVWTIKRRIFDLDSYSAIFVCLYGRAGAGKSQALKNFLRILPKDRVDNAGYSKGLFEDGRENFRFVNAYAIILDELCGLSKTELNAIKGRIDTDDITWRQMYSNSLSGGRNYAQLLGTSNTHLKNILLTEHDIRKWAEIKIAEYSNDEEIQSKLILPLEQFDWVNLWRSVNENDKSPFQMPGVYQKFKEWTAKECATESDLAIFLQDMVAKYGGQTLNRQQLYDNEYCRAISNPRSRLLWRNFLEKVELFRGFQYVRHNAGMVFKVPTSFDDASPNADLVLTGEE